MKNSLFLLFFSLFLYGEERPLYEGHFKTESTSVYLPLTIEGKTCSFLFDTGASFVVLDKGFEHLLGEPLSVEQAQARTGLVFATKEVITPNGTIALELYKALPLKLGKLQIANKYPYVTADLKSVWPFSGEKFCGILGSSFLHQFRWELDFKKGEIKAYIGVEPYSGTYTTRSRLNFSRAKIPQVLIDLHGKEVIFDLDTGDNGSGRVQKEELKFLQVKKEVNKISKNEVVTISALTRGREFRVKNFDFEGINYTNMVMQLSDQNAIGLAFLKRHKVVFDFPFKTLYLKAYDDFLLKEEVDKSGLGMVLKGEKLIVHSIKEMEGADLDGIAIGDEIISLDGKRVSLYTLRQAFFRQEGTVLNLQVRSKNKIFDARLVLGKSALD